MNDAYGNPVPDLTISLDSSRGAKVDTIIPSSGVTDASGQVAFAVKSSSLGTATFTATDTGNSFTLRDTTSVGFYHQGFNILHELTDYSVGGSTSSLTFFEGSLYGTHSYGITSFGAVFRIDPSGAGFQTVYSFSDASTGDRPLGGLIARNGSLYGTTSNGGAHHSGTIYKMNPDGTLHRIHDFSSTNGCEPQGTLTLSGDVLYGVTASGGSDNLGSVFRINVDGSGFATIHSFSGLNGQGPHGSLVMKDGVLYGTTFSGGLHGFGTVFKINTNGTDFSVLHSFDGRAGVYPASSLSIDGGILYGATEGDDGENSYGSIFAMNPDGTGFTNLHSFNNENGREPRPLLLSGGLIFGATHRGGPTGGGSLFSIKPDGSNFTSLHHFEGPAVSMPSSGMVEHDGVFYGAASVPYSQPLLYVYIP